MKKMVKRRLEYAIVDMSVSRFFRLNQNLVENRL